MSRNINTYKMVLTQYTQIRGLHLSTNKEFLAISSLFFIDYVA